MSKLKMKSNIPARSGIPLILAFCLVLAGCQTAPKSLYQWGGYQSQLYQHFKGESPNRQIDILEKDLQRINAEGNMPPPGFHAHLGLLYSMVGQESGAIEQFLTEKKLFPESATYMDFLLKKTKKSEQ
jgi:hypothetical protein